MKRRTFLGTTLIATLSGRTLVQATEGCRVKGAPRVLPALDVTPVRADQLYMIGDWGARSRIQRRVADAMGSRAEMHGSPMRILSVGDNIYNSGVDSADDPLWKSTYENIYTQPAIQVPWIAVLGNHDYRKSFQAQIDYGKKNTRWIMPSRYFVRLMTGSTGASIAVFCLDTQMILQKMDGWKEQLEWLDASMKEHSTVTWKIVIGHHPMRSYGSYGDQQWMIKHVKPILDKQGAHMYACGHDHNLQIITHPDDGFVSVVTGAGGGCTSTRWGEHTVAAATNGGFVSVDLNEKNLRMTIITADGGEIGSHTLAAGTRP